MALDELTADDVRCLLGQGIGVRHLLPVAHRLLDAAAVEDEDDAVSELLAAQVLLWSAAAPD